MHNNYTNSTELVHALRQYCGRLLWVICMHGVEKCCIVPTASVCWCASVARGRVPEDSEAMQQNAKVIAVLHNLRAQAY